MDENKNKGEQQNSRTLLLVSQSLEDARKRSRRIFLFVLVTSADFLLELSRETSPTRGQREHANNKLAATNRTREGSPHH